MSYKRGVTGSDPVAPTTCVPPTDTAAPRAVDPGSMPAVITCARHTAIPKAAAADRGSAWASGTPGDQMGTTRSARPARTTRQRAAGTHGNHALSCDASWPSVLGVKGSRVQIPPSRPFFERRRAYLGPKWDRSWSAGAERCRQCLQNWARPRASPAGAAHRPITWPGATSAARSLWRLALKVME
jgi:hypothetical protein